MKIQERYSVARNTSNLKSEENTVFAAADVISAAGMAAQRHAEALQLWEVAFQGKTSAKIKLIDMLERKLQDHMIRASLKGKPRQICIDAVSWYLHGTCQPCGGRGYEINLGTPTLSDRLCKHCQGAGKLPYPDSDAHKWVKDYMDRLTAQAGGQIMRKLAKDMEL